MTVNKTISSVSALIALSAATASAEIRAAPFSNVGLDITVDMTNDHYDAYLDLNGDSNDDFDVWRNVGYDILEGDFDNEVVVDDLVSWKAKRFAWGADIGSSETTYTRGDLTNWIGMGRSYAGVKLVAEGTTNWGWIEFTFPDSSTGMVVRGAWETVPGKSITAGAWPGTVIPSNGSYAGGNTVTVTNSNFGAITNVTVGGVAATIQGSGTNWAKITTPATGSAGVKDIVIQTDNGDLLLAGAYTVLSAGSTGLRCMWTDFNGDGISDMALFGPPTGDWYIRTVAGTALAWQQKWGYLGAWPVPGDYDGDGVSDLAVYDPAAGRWYISTLAGKVLAWQLNWGYPGTVGVPGDYDGDGICDLAVYDNKTGNWYIRTVAGKILAWGLNWGYPGTIAVPGDYDGDGICDLAVYDNKTGNWYIRTVAGKVLAWG